MAETSLANEIFGILSRGSGARGSGSGIDDLLLPITANLEATRRTPFKSSSLNLRASAPEPSVRLVSNSAGAEQAAEMAAAAGPRPSSVAAALQSSPHFRPTALTASPPAKPSLLQAAAPSTPQRMFMRSSTTAVYSTQTVASSNVSIASSAVPSLPSSMGGAASMHRSTESCPGYANPRRAFAAEEQPPQQSSGSPNAMQRHAGGHGSQSMRSRRVTTPGIVESSMLAAPQQQQTVRQQAAGSTQPAPRASNGGQGSVSPGPPSTGRLSSGGQPSLHRLSSTGAPSEGALSPLQGGAGRGAQGLQPLLEQLAHIEASPTNLAADTTGQQTGTQPRGGEGGVPGNDWERRSRRSRRSSDVGEADEPSLHSVPFDPVASPSRGPPQTQAPQQQIGLISFGVTPIGVAVQDSSLKASQGPAGAQTTSPTSGSGGPSPGAVPAAAAPGDRSFKTITSVRARAPIMSILQQGPLGKKDAKAAPQPAPQPSRQLAYSKSLSLKGQQEFLRQQKAEQEALEKIKEEQEKKQKDAQEKQEQEQLEREIQMYMDPRSTLGYSSSVAVRPANSTDTGTAAAAAAAVAAVDAAAAAPPAERALAASTSIRPATRVVNPTLNSSVARPPAAPVAPAPVVPPGPYTGVVPTASRIAGIAAQQALKSAVKTPEDPEKDTAARAAQDTTQLLKYEQQLLAAKLAEIQLKKQQQRQEGGTDGALIDDDDAETDREEEEAPSPPSESLLRWIEENNMRMNQKLRGRMVGP